MSGKTSLPLETVKLIKVMLAQGKPQSQIAAISGVAQGTISRIKSGQLHPTVPWPDGSIGAMPDGAGSTAAPREAHWSAMAKRYLAFSEEVQERILLIVNERRSHIGLPPIPNRATAYEEYLNSEPLDEAFEASRLMEAREAEDDRLALVMQEFDAIVAEESSILAEQELEAALVATREERLQESPMKRPIPTYTAYGWEELLALAPKNRLLQQVAILDDAVTKEAACIAFWETRKTRGAWDPDESPSIERITKEIAEKLRTWPELVTTIEEKYKRLAASKNRME